MSRIMGASNQKQSKSCALPQTQKVLILSGFSAAVFFYFVLCKCDQAVMLIHIRILYDKLQSKIQDPADFFSRDSEGKHVVAVYSQIGPAPSIAVWTRVNWWKRVSNRSLPGKTPLNGILKK